MRNSSCPVDATALVARLALARLPALKASEKARLLPLAVSSRGLTLLRPRDLEAMTGRPLRLGAWDPAALWAAAEADADLLARLGARYLTIVDGGYPAALREIPQPPFGLYLLGADLPADRPALALVGTRYPTGLGLAEAERFGREAAALGLPLVSGLARGIDAGGHRGALAGGGSTCAVLPCGIETVYPRSHRGLAAAIVEGGGLMATEYPPGTEPQKWRFPERNRIISGLARSLLVVEAPAASGALITADFALEQGRDVYVAASRLASPRSAGLDRLAAEGARPVDSVRDLLADWGLETGTAVPAVQDLEDLPGWAGESRACGLALSRALKAELSLGAEDRP